MSNRSAMIQKVKALLAKTTDAGCTEAEALAALGAASRLRDAYEITDDDLIEQRRDGVEFTTTNPATDPEEIRMDLIAAIAIFTGTKSWREYAYKPKAKTPRKFTFVGPRPDVEFASWLLDSLAHFVENQTFQWVITAPIPPNYTADKAGLRAAIAHQTTGFVKGCTSRIAERLRSLAPNPATPTANALVVITKQQIKEAMDKRGIRLTTAAVKFRESDAAARAAGRLAGDRASFARPLAPDGSSQKLLK